MTNTHLPADTHTMLGTSRIIFEQPPTNTTAEALLRAQAQSERAVAEWRMALAERWDCEVAALRLYKQIMRQMIEHYGRLDMLEVQLAVGGTLERHTTPGELLNDLCHLRSALVAGDLGRPFADRLAELTITIAALDQAISVAAQRETARRTAARDRRAAEEDHHRTSRPRQATIELEPRDW